MKSPSKCESLPVWVKGAANVARQHDLLLISGFDKLTKCIHTLTTNIATLTLQEGIPNESHQERKDIKMVSLQALTAAQEDRIKKQEDISSALAAKVETLTALVHEYGETHKKIFLIFLKLGRNIKIKEIKRRKQLV